MKQLKDLHSEKHGRSHSVPLVLYEEVEQRDHQSEETLCSACWIPIVGKNYSCTDCNYCIHYNCGEAPQVIPNHPLHHDDDRALHLGPSMHSTITCGICKFRDSRDEYSFYYPNVKYIYTCYENGCSESFHINCVLFSLSVLAKHSGTLKHDAYPLPLALFQNHTLELSQFDCIICRERLVNSIYVSDDFEDFFHQKCLDILPGILDHPCDRDHTLILDSNRDSMLCNICQEEHRGAFYGCSHCDFNVNVACAWPSPVIEDEEHHEHPFHLFWSQTPFVCDACGIGGDFCSYICFICHYQVHPKCISLPQKIKVTRHPSHRLSHNYFLRKKELAEQDCQICFQVVKTRHGCYYCTKPNCEYIVHVKCALEDDDLYLEIDPNDSSEDEEIIESSITEILEKNENGDAVKIKHCFHEQHYLMLGDTSMTEKDDQYCVGCMQLISGPFYSCSECDFLLHKPCAELPRKRNHFSRINLFELNRNDLFQCHGCTRACTGFVYKCIDYLGRLYHCLNCANVSDTIMYPDHEHLLFWDPKIEMKCNCCGVRDSSHYRCIQDCDFALCRECITLPREVRNKCDTHLLKLSSTDGKDDPTQCYCDICEELRDPPDHWFYHCSVCDTSTHRECVPGKYPFIRIGTKLKIDEHNITFFRKNYYYPDQCYICHKLCQDLSVECKGTSLNYIAHYECLQYDI